MLLIPFISLKKLQYTLIHMWLLILKQKLLQQELLKNYLSKDLIKGKNKNYFAIVLWWKLLFRPIGYHLLRGFIRFRAVSLFLKKQRTNLLITCINGALREDGTLAMDPEKLETACLQSIYGTQNKVLPN